MTGYGVEHLRPPNKAMNLSMRKSRGGPALQAVIIYSRLAGYRRR